MTLLKLALVVALLTACSAPVVERGSAGVPAQPISPGSQRWTVFISDLHMGVGRDPSNAWFRIEDFRWEREFALFLNRLNQEGGGRIDLVLNGDTFELWESATHDCVYPDRNLGCTEVEALTRVKRVLSQHAEEFKALTAFAASGTNTVTILPGNHDAALLFPAVAREVLSALPAPTGRVRILNAGYWVSPDGLLYAEHGHQIGEEVNRFTDWPQPFVSGPGGLHLRRPWGEKFVQSYYNQFETKYPIIDNVSDERVAIRYAMAAEGGLRAALDSAEFVRFFLFGVSWAQLRQALGPEGESPEWDISRIRAEGDRFIVESFPAGDPVRAEAVVVAAEGRLPLSMTSLSDGDIRAICDQRALLAARNAQSPDPRFSVSPCPTTHATLGAAGQYLLSSRDEVFGAHLKQTSDAIGQRERRFAVFLFGHTHLVDRGFRPLERERLGWDPVVVNSGAWQRVVSPDTLAMKNRPAATVLQDSVESLPACYSVVWVEPYTTVPEAKVRSWRQTPDGSWDFGPMCNE